MDFGTVSYTDLTGAKFHPQRRLHCTLHVYPCYSSYLSVHFWDGLCYGVGESCLGKLNSGPEAK